MIKNVKEIDRINSMSYSELFDLQRRLKGKIQRKKREKRDLEKIYNNLAEKYKDSDKPLDNLAVSEAHYMAQNMNAEIIILEEALKQATARINAIKKAYTPTQFGE